MPDESRVKPQPLQPEELKAIEARCEAAAPGPWKREGDAVYTAHECGDTCERTLNDHFVFADPDVKPADAKFIAHARSDIPRLIATIEEARREQPVTDEAIDADSVEYANKVQTNLSRPDAFVWMIARNAYLAGAKKREQPVRVTDEQLLTEFREWLAAVQRADRAGIITIGFGVPQRVCAALAAAPKEGEE